MKVSPARTTFVNEPDKYGETINSSLVQVSNLFILYDRLLKSNLTDLQVAKTNRGRSVSQVLKYYRCQKERLTITVFQKQGVKCFFIK